MATSPSSAVTAPTTPLYSHAVKKLPSFCTLVRGGGSRFFDERLVMESRFTGDGAEPECRDLIYSNAVEFADFTDGEFAALRAMANLYPNLDTVASELAFRQTQLTRPPGNVHIISDVHGDANKLCHVLANGSGTLRPFVEEALSGVTPTALTRLLCLLFNPNKFVEEYQCRLYDENDSELLLETIVLHLIVVMRAAVKMYSIDQVRSMLPVQFSKVLNEMIFSPLLSSSDVLSPTAPVPSFVTSMAASFRRSNRLAKFLRCCASLIQTFVTSELVVGGDLWDRGPRGDRVCEILMNHPNVWITWGNHDVLWMGAALGCTASMCCALRVSLRYNVLAQLEEGYGISLAPIEQLANALYADDPASRFMPKPGTGHRDRQTIARMQKAVAVMQWKLEGQIIKRHPEFGLEADLILHTFDLEQGTCRVGEKTYDLMDRKFPTIVPSSEVAYELTAEEQRCVELMKQQFYRSSKLWEHIKFMINRGSLYVVRHHHLIFHGAVPVDKVGNYLQLEVNGEQYEGRALFEALGREIICTLRQPTEYRRDLLWYCWMGPRSPFMAKDRVATLQRDLIADKETHVEPKNPYFKLIDEEWFCEKILEEFGCDPNEGIIINGHVPVSVSADQNPVRKSGKAIQIDGAFSEAYGDYGYTLVIEPSKHRSVLAQHHKVNDAFDVTPKITVVGRFENLAQMYHSEIEGEIFMLERLQHAFELNKIPQVPSAKKLGHVATAFRV